MSECELNDGDIAMMMAATAFVMLQTPAMGVAQAGMIRRKNSLSMLMQTLSGLVFGSILWFVFGFSLTFGNSLNGFIGDGTYAFLRNIPADSCLPDFSNTIPGLLYVSFQMMFAIMVPVIVTGAWAEKMTFLAFIVFVITWPICVYYPVAHWVWNPNGWLGKMGVMDFAGGITIHTTSGCAAFVAASYLQRRERLGERPQHHNMPLSILGGSLIWAGWYSFNGGSALKANIQAAVALLNTHLAGCAGAFMWTVLAYYRDRHWHLSEIIGGAYAGLAAVTPGSGYVSPGSALIIGLLGGTASFFSVPLIKDRLRIDDVLDVTSLQGVAGAVGSLMVGIFADSQYQDGNPGTDGLLITGDGTLLGVQALALIVTIAWTVVFTNLIFLLMPRFFNPDVSAYVDEVGLDIDQIGERAYDEELDLLLDTGLEGMTVRLCEAASKGDFIAVKKILLSGADAEGQDYDGRCPVALAASEGHLKIIKYLCEQHGASINTCDRYQRSPLDDAQSHGHTEVVDWLLSKGAVSGTRGHGALGSDMESETLYASAYAVYEATMAENTAKLTSLLDKVPNNAALTDYDRRGPLHLACAEGKAASVRVLLAAGAPTDSVDRWGLTPADEASRYRHAVCLKLVQESNFVPKHIQMTVEGYGATRDTNESGASYPKVSRISESPDKVLSLSSVNKDIKSPLIAKESTQTTTTLSLSSNPDIVRPSMSSAGVRALCAAARKNDVEGIKRIIKKEPEAIYGADYDLRSALHVASSEGHIEAVKELLKYPDVRVNTTDRWKRTPLQDAVAFHHFAVASVLREHGATVVNEKLAFMLCMAASKGDLAFIKRQAELGKDLSVSDYDGRTALHLAASENQVEIVEYLVNEMGVRVDPVDRMGNSPLVDARSSEVQRILSSSTV